MITIVHYVPRQSHENTQIMIHKMRDTAHKILNGKVITIPVMENSHTNLEEIVLVVEMLIIAHAEIKVMVINILKLKEAVIKDHLVEVHGEAEHMQDEPTAEANLLIKMTIVYQVWDIPVTKILHNTATFVAYAPTKAIMTINAIMLNK